MAAGHDGPERSGSDPLPDSPAERVREIVERVASEVYPDATVELEETEDAITVTVSGEDLGLLIGKHGATIDAVQHIAVRAAFRGDARKAVVVDASGYRARREAVLLRLAERAVEDALSFERPIELEPMSAPERRVVHTHLKDRPDVETHSEGDEPERRLVVSPVRSDA